MLVYSEKRTSLLFIFFLYFFFETCVGGSGGLISYGDITLRKVNFVLALGVTAFLVYSRKKLDYETLRLTLIFMIMLFANTLIGIYNYGNDARISENFLAQFFFVLLPFYPFFIRTERHVKIITKVIVCSALLQAVAYIALVVLLFLGVINFLNVYQLLTQSSEFMGRGELAFWYKGFLYMCLGIYFMHIIPRPIYRHLAQLLILVALLLTLVRGFVLAIFGTAIIYNFFFKSKIQSIAIIVIALISIILLKSSFDSNLNRDESNRVRIVQLQQVADEITPVSFFIGHGLGKGVQIRQNHMEINYLEIFHKQGIIGVGFWIYLLVYIIMNYVNVMRLRPENEIMARPFILATIFVYLESLTNPFLTNSIGLNVIMVSIVCLNVLKQTNTNEI